MINKFFNYVNKNFGRYLFNCPNRLYYNIFNKLHLNFIARKRIEDKNIKEYLEKGFFKTRIKSVELCKFISSELQKQKIQPENFRFVFRITDEMKNEIKKHINNEFKIVLKSLERFYNSKIVVSQIFITRNFHINSSEKKEFYSNNYHVDASVYNHFKVFLNLMDVDVDQGPLNFYSKKDTKKFVKTNNYKNRSNYINRELNDCLINNTGYIGDSILVNTTQCLHKAGVIKKGNHRDMLFISFIAIPERVENKDDFFYFDKKFPGEIWGEHGELNKIAKPKSFINTLKLFFMYYKNKLN